MRIQALLLLAVLSVCVVCRADTFTIYTIGADDKYTDPQIDAGGDVLLSHDYPCGFGSVSATCFQEFQKGALIYQGETEPSGFSGETGVSCAPPIPGAGRSQCNAGFQVYDYDYDIREGFPGGDPLGMTIVRGSLDGIALNGSGDFVVFDGQAGYTYQVIINSTPEPSSFALLGTGLLGVAGVVRKRFA